MTTYMSPISYAQAAKGATQPASSQASSSKVTSGTVSPANGAFTELSKGGNWADDVEATVEAKASVPQKKDQEETKVSQSKDNVYVPTKAEDKNQGVPSGISSPDLAASASTTTKEDDAASAHNGNSSESTWDTKSQTSEPAWIADRKERQNGTPSSEKPSKGDKKSKEGKDTVAPTPPMPVVLQPAAPPTVNVWLQRAETQRAKAFASQPKPTLAAAPVEPAALKENQRPQSGPRRKANSVTGVPRESIGVASEEINRSNALNLVSNEDRSDSPLTAAAKADRENAQAPPAPTLKDDVQWPTPDSVQDKERKIAAEKDTDGQRNEAVTPTLKGKSRWQNLPVIPLYTKPDIGERKSKGPPNGERSSRNVNGGKGRGPQRGASNPTGSAERERENPRSNSTPHDPDRVVSTQDSASVAGDASVTAIPSKPARSSSASPRGQQKKDGLPGRKFSRQPTGDAMQSELVGQDGGKLETSKDTSFSKPFSEGRRTKSPKKISPPGDRLDDEFVPKPIPRRNSTGIQTDDMGENVESSTREGPPTRPIQFDGRKDSRNHESLPAYPPGRPSKRGGRGRGGNIARDFTNGQQGSGAYSNGYGTDFPIAAPYAVPQSPGFPSPRGHHQFAYPPQRGTWRGNPRSQSIPLESLYNQNARAAFSTAPHAMHGIQTFTPAMYEMSYPMSAVSFPPQMETERLMELVSTQMEYYFSVNNLIKDMFLRKHMDSQGFVFLDIIANFNRIKQLTQDKELIKAVCINSQNIEIRIGEDGKERLRKREGYEQFCLPMEQREPSAQTDGPQHLERPERPQLFLNGIPPQFHGPQSAGLPNMHQRFDRRSYDSAYPMVNGYPPQFATYPSFPEGMYSESMNGDEPRGRPAKSPIHENVTSPMEQPMATGLGGADFEPDSFPDDQVSVLTVVVKNLREDKAPYHTAASRTFSNGSIDSRSIMSEMQKPSEAKSQASTNGETLVNGGDNKLSLSRTLSPNKPQSNERAASNADVNVFWVKDQDYPVQNLPSDLTPEPYMQLRQRALEDRDRAVTGNCPYDLDILYQFWCHFLLRNFNNSMYSEFRYFANKDAQERYCFAGLNNLVQFYSKSLSSHNPIRDRVVKDYVELVKTEPPKMEGAAFKTLRSAWRNGALNLKNRKKLADILDGELKEQLDKVES